MQGNPLYKIGVLLFVCLLSAFRSQSQNLEELGFSKGVDLNGSINLNTIGYHAHGLEQRRESFNWFVSGNLNVNLFGYSAPFSFTYSNVNTNYTQPFNQMRFAPQYKNVKTYIGYSSMTFSSYTLSGHVFMGGGIEVSPGNWRIAAMYGRLRKAVEFSLTDSLQHTNASFKRMGYGLKIGYEKNGNTISANIFSAKDDTNSIPFVIPGSQLIPMENVTISVSGRKQFLKRFFVDAEYAISAMNVNTEQDNSEKDSTAYKPTHNLVKGLLPENASKRYYDALNSSIGYSGNWYSIQLRYERVAPEYQTLGAYYFNSDLQNVTIIPSVRILQNTLTLSGNLGFQRNNLDEGRAATTKRVVGAINANYIPTEKWNLNLSYSNFSSFTNTKPLTDPNFQNNLDTLNFYQISETFSGSVMKTLGKKDSPQAITLNVSHQVANNESGYEGGDETSTFLSSTISYSYSMVPSNLIVALATNIYTTNAAGIKTMFYGPTASISKSLINKTLRGSWASSFNKTAGKNIPEGSIWNNRFNINYTPPGKESSSSRNTFSLSMNALRQFGGTQNQSTFTELTGTLNYSYTF